MFLYYANEGSDDVIDRPTKTIKYWIKNISRNIGAVIFILGTRNVHHKRNKVTPTILLPWQHPWFQSLSVKNKISPFAAFLSGTGGLPRNRHGSHIQGSNWIKSEREARWERQARSWERETGFDYVTKIQSWVEAVVSLAGQSIIMGKCSVCGVVSMVTCRMLHLPLLLEDVQI